MDYEAWVRRAKGFLRKLNELPGVIEIYDSIEPSDHDEHSLSWHRSPKNSIPSEVKDFLITASRRAAITYRWEPPQEIIEDICRIWPGKAILIGGGDLCEQARYSTYDVDDDDLAGMIEMVQESHDAVKAMFAGKDEIPLPEINIENTFNEMFGAGDQGSEAGLVPILIFPDEARLSLDTTGSDSIPYPVVYTKAGSFDQPIPISPGFDQFLKDWETLCYLSPDPETLKPWLNGPENMLNVASDKTELLRKIFFGAFEHERPQSSLESPGYRGWCARAENFVRTFGRGPGERGISVKIAPPVDAETFDEKTAGFSYRVPDGLKRFYIEGSGDFTCTYVWRLAGTLLEEFEKIIPYRYTIWGGLDLVPWNELEPEPGYYCYWEEEEEDACLMGRLAIPVWNRTVPFIHLGNGDIIGFYVGEDGYQEKVVLLLHDYPEDSVKLLADSIDDFFQRLEQQSYLGAEICSMGTFYPDGDIEKPPEEDPEKLRQLNAILSREE